MKRKLIKQGAGGVTFYVPKKWVDSKGLKPGDEIEVDEQDDNLIIRPGEAKKEIKRAEIEIDLANFNIYRSILGGLYRGGYDEVKVYFKDPKVIPVLQKTVDSTFYGFEIFDVKDDSCLIKSVYTEEATEIKNHINRIIHTIKTMQEIIINDIEKNNYVSKEELLQFRSNILKHRDLVARVITQQRLLDNKNFPYHQIGFNLWNIGRNYYNLYKYLTKDTEVTKANIDYLKKVNAFFAGFFDKLKEKEVVKKHKEYDVLIDEGIKLMKNKKEASFIISYCINILMMLQSCNSSLLLINF